MILFMTSRYYTKKLNDNVYLINDDLMCSTYVIVGSKYALVIDTGIPTNEELLLPLIKKITNLPLKVVITHAHFDHIGHLKEFDNYYIALKEYENIKDESLKENAIIIEDKHVFDLGDVSIEAYISDGHTSASTILLDKNKQIAFTGDQFGSGCGVWMQVNEASTLSVYSKEIEKFISYLNSFSSLNDWIVYGGHYGQEETGRLGYNPLNIEMIINLKHLSNKLINNEIELLESKINKIIKETIKKYF